MMVECENGIKPIDKYPSNEDLAIAYQVWEEVEGSLMTYDHWKSDFIVRFGYYFYRNSNADKIVLPKEGFLRYAYHVDRLKNFCDWMEVGSYMEELLSRVDVGRFMFAIKEFNGDLSKLLTVIEDRFEV